MALSFRLLEMSGRSLPLANDVMSRLVWLSYRWPSGLRNGRDTSGEAELLLVVDGRSKERAVGEEEGEVANTV